MREKRDEAGGGGLDERQKEGQKAWKKRDQKEERGEKLNKGLKKWKREETTAGHERKTILTQTTGWKKQHGVRNQRR